MNLDQLLNLILKAGIYPSLLVYIIIKGIKILENMNKSISIINRELGEIKIILEKKNG